MKARVGNDKPIMPEEPRRHNHPGPWRVRDTKGSLSVEDSAGRPIATIHRDACTSVLDAENTAALIAAAPAMQAALSQAFHLLVQIGYPPGIMRAIGEALGQSMNADLPLTWESLAARRLSAMASLKGRMDTLMAVPEGNQPDDWFRWLATAPPDILVAWAESLQQP